MTKLLAVTTEKSMEQAKQGRYTFKVDRNLNKYQIKNLIEKVFKVKVTNVRTVKLAGELKRTALGRKKVSLPQKKAIVTLAEKDKIDLFETKKGK